MLLYLLRHADADTPAATDEARALSEKGKSQAEKVARFCEAHEMNLSVLLSSPVRRAHETAKIVASKMCTELTVAPWLACGMRPQKAIEELRVHQTQESVMLVGHEPDFSQFIAHLIGLPTNTSIHVRKASLTLIEFDFMRAGAGRLQFSLPCKLM